MNKKSLVLWGLLFGLTAFAYAGGSNPAAGAANAFLTTTSNTADAGTTNTFDKLVVSGNANIATNRGAVSLSLSPFVINARYTNGAFRSFVSASIKMNNASGGSIQTELWDITSTTQSIAAVGISAATAVQTNTFQVSGMIGPNAIIMFTNTVAGTGASAAMVTNSLTQL